MVFSLMYVGKLLEYQITEFAFTTFVDLSQTLFKKILYQRNFVFFLRKEFHCNVQLEQRGE